MEHIAFKIEFESEPFCVGTPMPTATLEFVESFTEEEVSTMKQVVKESTFDKELGLMPVLKKATPTLFAKLDHACQSSIRSYFRNKEAEILKVYLEDCEQEEDCAEGEKNDEETYDYVCCIPEQFLS